MDLNKIADNGQFDDRHADQYDILDSFTHQDRLDNECELVFYGIATRAARKIRPAD